MYKVTEAIETPKLPMLVKNCRNITVVPVNKAAPMKGTMARQLELVKDMSILSY